MVFEVAFNHNPIAFELDLFFTAIVVLMCALIYYRTKESYELTGYKGISFFRTAFLFFGISYAIRLVFKLLMLYQVTTSFFIPRELVAFLILLPLGYFSTMSIMYLLFSTIWKRINIALLVPLSHLFSAIIAITAFLLHTRPPNLLLMYTQCILLVIIIGINIFFPSKKPNQKTQLSFTKTMYLLASFAWLISIFVLEKRHPFDIWIEIISYCVTLGVFIILYFKTSKWIK